MQKGIQISRIIIHESAYPPTHCFGQRTINFTYRLDLVVYCLYDASDLRL